VAVLCEDDDVLNKLVLLCFSFARTLFPGRSALAQKLAIPLQDLPLAGEPERKQNLIFFSAAQDKPEHVWMDEAREQSKSGAQTEADGERQRRQEEV
jgi:hypothetical protein